MLLTHVSGQECESRYHQFSLITHSNPSSSSRRNTYDFTCLSLTILQSTLSRGLSSASSPITLRYWGGRQVILLRLRTCQRMPRAWQAFQGVIHLMVGFPRKSGGETRLTCSSPSFQKRHKLAPCSTYYFRSWWVELPNLDNNVCFLS